MEVLGKSRTGSGSSPPSVGNQPTLERDTLASITVPHSVRGSGSSTSLNSSATHGNTKLITHRNSADATVHTSSTIEPRSPASNNASIFVELVDKCEEYTHLPITNSASIGSSSTSPPTSAGLRSQITPPRRSLDADYKTLNSPSRSAGCSPQSTVHGSLVEVLSARSSMERALFVATGSHQIPDNQNTMLINQLNKNYLKNICRQNKARNDWKSLKAKLSALRRKDSGERVDSTLQIPSSSGTSNKRSSLTPQDEGIICKKEDLIKLLQNAPVRQRKPLKSISDVVLQLRNDGRIGSAKNTSLPPSTSIAPEVPKTSETSHSTLPSQITSNKGESKPEVKANNSPPQLERKKSPPKSKVTVEETPEANKGAMKSMLKSSTSMRSPRSSATVSVSLPSTIRKKKVKIVDADCKGEKCPVAKASSSAAAISSERKNKEVKQKKASTKTEAIEAQEKELEERLRKETFNDISKESTIKEENDKKATCSKEESVEDEEDDPDNQVKWDESNIVDASALGDAIQAFLRGISSSSIGSDKKVSFKK